MFERQNVILSALRLMRAMRRHPPRPEGTLPPAVERFLCELAKNEGASSRDMCEVMDMRPSSMSELIARIRGDVLEKTGFDLECEIKRMEDGTCTF